MYPLITYLATAVYTDVHINSFEQAMAEVWMWKGEN